MLRKQTLPVYIFSIIAILFFSAKAGAGTQPGNGKVSVTVDVVSATGN